MRFRSFLLIVGVLTLSLLPPGSANAGFNPRDLEKDSKVEPRAKVPVEANPFFNALDPRSSSRGNVKTYQVRVRPAQPRKKVIPGREINLPQVEVVMNRTSRGFLVPVNGEISSLFGRRVHPFRRRGVHFHTGIDIRAKTGTAIRPAMGGRVVYAGWRRGYGLMVQIAHGSGYSTVYAHCSKLNVRVGDTVTGQVIGNVGSTGVTTGSHLHFEIRRGNTVLNPMAYLRR